MATNSTFRVLDSVEIAMRDGSNLRANVWLPDEAGQWPVLLQRTPYQKDDAFSTLDFLAALRRGYAIVVQDTRGRFASDGTFTPFANEAEDGTDTIAWLRQQSFCNGQVMMFGGSYVGATQVLAAAAHPEGLIAVSPFLTTARHGDSWTYRGGAHELAFLLLWVIESLAPEDLRRRLDDMPEADAERARRVLADFQKDPQVAFARLPILDDDLIALAPYAATWFNAERAGSAEKDREHLDALQASEVPFLVTPGWNDLFAEGAIELFETVRSRWNHAADVRDRLIIGPWSHCNPTDWQGDNWLGYAASTATLVTEQLAFFDAAKTGTVPATPMVRYFRSGSNTWHSAADWPLPDTGILQLYLSESGLGPITSEDWSRTYTSDTLNPVPTIGGANYVPGLHLGRNSGPKDQKHIESRDDVLIFTSEPLDTDLDVTGLVELTVWVASDAPTADWTARLCDVDSTGRSTGLVDGIYRQPVCSKSPVKVVVRLGHISHLFAKGNRIRLQIASSNFPRFDRNPQSLVSSVLARPSEFKPAHQTVVGGPRFLSRLALPVLNLS